MCPAMAVRSASFTDLEALVRRPAPVDLLQACGLGIFATSVGFIYWPAGGIVLGLALAAIGVLHDNQTGGDA